MTDRLLRLTVKNGLQQRILEQHRADKLTKVNGAVVKQSNDYAEPGGPCHEFAALSSQLCAAYVQLSQRWPPIG